MKPWIPFALAAGLMLQGAALASTHAAAGKSHGAASPSDALPQLFTPDGMRWVEAMNSLPRGVRMTVTEGDPARSGPYTLRLWLPAGCRIEPYWRSDSERLTVMLGAVILGLGDHFDDRQGAPIKAGSFALVPARRHHYLWTRDVAVVQMHGQGPWAMNYIDPALDPRHAKKGSGKH
jgi:hypothetical protein